MGKASCSSRANGGGSSRRSRFVAAASWLLVVAWAAGIFLMSSQQSSGVSTGFFGEVRQWGESVLALLGLAPDWFNAICHFAEYLILGVLLANALGLGLSRKSALLLAVVLASAYGASDEIHQHFVPTRVCDPLDWMVDTLGGAVGALLHRCSLWLFRAFSHSRPHA